MAVLASRSRACRYGPMSAHLYWLYGPLFMALTFLAFIVAGIGNA